MERAAEGSRCASNVGGRKEELVLEIQGKERRSGDMFMNKIILGNVFIFDKYNILEIIIF